MIIYLSFVICIILIVYHHVGYSLLLRLVAKKKKVNSLTAPSHEYAFTFVLPFYNESEFFEHKINNINELDYPMDKIHVLFANDGSSDDSVMSLTDALNRVKPSFSYEVIDYNENKGKLARINQLCPRVDKKAILFFSDISSMLSANTLQRANTFFNQSKIGVFSTCYVPSKNATEGEKKYWLYQNQVKQYESKLGTPMGYPGAGYAMRASLFNVLPKDTINDDFVLPLSAIAQGYQGVFDKKSLSHEMEGSTELMDWARRIRISKGNIQQIELLADLFRFGSSSIRWMFFSGKMLRVCMPWCFLNLYIMSFILIVKQPWLMASFFLIQTGFYVLITSKYALKYKILRVFRYLFYGHLATLGAWFEFLNPIEDMQWTKVNDFTLSTPSPLPVRIGKWVMDKCLALIGMIGVIVSFPFIAIALKLTSPGPIFFKQLRVGKTVNDRTKLFYLYKYRTMVVDAEKEGAKWASKNDPRITRLGLFLRKTRLDEIPQFWNVLKGDMSIVGPRPERPEFYQKLENKIPYYSERLYGLLPGITGFAQVYLKYDENIEDVRKKVGFDHAYAACLTDTKVWFKTDIHIILKTFSVVINKLGQ